MQQITLITDASRNETRGIMSWCCIFREGNQIRNVLTGIEEGLDNNKMELLAIERGLSHLKEPCEVQVLTDSEYVMFGYSEGKKRWAKKGWLNSRNKPISDPDLWKSVYELATIHKVQLVKVRSHKNKDNRKADRLAKGAIRSFLRNQDPLPSRYF